MPSRRCKDNQDNGKDEIPIARPDKHDTNMYGDFFDQPGRRRTTYHDSHEPARQPLRHDHKYSGRPFEPENSRRRASSSDPYDICTPGLSSLESPPEKPALRCETKFFHNATSPTITDSSTTPLRARRRSSSLQTIHFSASQATTLHNPPPARSHSRPSSPKRDAHERRARSRIRKGSRNRSCCDDSLAPSSEKQQHGPILRIWPWLRRPMGEVTRRETMVVTVDSDDERERHGSGRRKE